jgi:hypothetical protein
MAARLDQSFTLFGKKIDKSGKNRVATEQIFSQNLSLHPSYHRTEISRYHFVIDIPCETLIRTTELQGFPKQDIRDKMHQEQTPREPPEPTSQRVATARHRVHLAVPLHFHHQSTNARFCIHQCKVQINVRPQCCFGLA